MVPKLLPPPHNGIGTEEDSLGSFLYLMPKVPKQDFKKLMENDGIQLRYLARFLAPQIEDKDRRFIITYYVNNDTVSVFEKFERNSGFIGGKFFERSKAKNPEVLTACFVLDRCLLSLTPFPFFAVLCATDRRVLPRVRLRSGQSD